MAMAMAVVGRNVTGSDDPGNYLSKDLLDFRGKSSCFYPRHYFTDDLPDVDF